MVAGVSTGVGFSNWKIFRTRIQRFWNKSGVGVWKCDYSHFCLPEGPPVYNSQDPENENSPLYSLHNSVGKAPDDRGCMQTTVSKSKSAPLPKSSTLYRLQRAWVPLAHCEMVSSGWFILMLESTIANESAPTSVSMASRKRPFDLSRSILITWANQRSWNSVVTRAGHLGSGQFGPAYKPYYIPFRVTIVFVLDVHVLCSSTWLLRVKCLWFSSANSVCKYSCVLLFFAQISLARVLRRWQRWGYEHAMGLLRKDKSLTRFLACKRWPTNWLFVPIALSEILSFMPIAPTWIVSW